MTCPDNKNCIERTTVGLGGNVLNNDDWLSEGSIVDYGNTIHPNQTIQYANNGDITNIGGSGHKRNESIAIRTRPDSPKFEEIWDAFKVIGTSTVCYESLVVNNPCKPIRNFKSVVITEINLPNEDHGETEGLITLTAVPI